MEETKHIQIKDYNYELPDERIAKFPLPERDQSKLLVYRHGTVGEDTFTSLPDYLPQGALMVFNNTKVIQARLHFHKDTGALIEVFCLEPVRPHDYALMFQQTGRCSWLCLVGNLKKWKSGCLSRPVEIGGRSITLKATRGENRGTSHWIDFEWDDEQTTWAEILEAVGELPIPPYLNRETQESDKTTYQTVYSKIKGSVAAPTAGLHFTERVLADLDAHGIDREEVTLHVGAGTFKPVKSEEIAGHEMHTEYICVHCRGHDFGAHPREPVLYRCSIGRKSRRIGGGTPRAAVDALRVCRPDTPFRKPRRRTSGSTHHNASPAKRMGLPEPPRADSPAHQYANHHSSRIRIPYRADDGHQFPPAAKYTVVTRLGFRAR